MQRKLNSTSLPIFPFVNYLSPEWELLVEYDGFIQEKRARIGRSLPPAVAITRQGAINIIMIRGQEGLYDAMSQMKFAWDLYKRY
jgi:hypothetical protein